MALTVLHTSDWHLGHQLYRKRREGEFAAFLDWLAQTIEENNVDVLIIAGDIFDIGVPATGAQGMYFDFLGKIARGRVRHVIITAGNHDSPAFLMAAAPILHSLDIHVIGSVGNVEEEVLLLRNRERQPELIICAAPFLRESEICQMRPGESVEDRERRIDEGIRDHFKNLADIAEALRDEYGRNLPVIATAHLFTRDINPAAEEGVRQIYRGNLGCVPVDYFPDVFDYVALGHIHRPGAVEGRPMRRYSGSPLPLTFEEAKHSKEVVLIRFEGREAELSRVSVPQFRKMISISGDTATILDQLGKLAAATGEDEAPVWVEIKHDGSDAATDLRDRCDELIKGANIDILCTKIDRPQQSLEALNLERSLEELQPEDIFISCLDSKNVPENERPELLESFFELLQIVREQENADS